MGDMTIATHMIATAQQCGANYTKFQKRNPKQAVPKFIQDQPHPCPHNAFGETYLQHRESLEFSIDKHKELKDQCKEHKIGYACSVWDVVSAEEIISLQPDYIKIPSAMNNNWQLINYVLNNFSGDVHISFGMAFPNEREELIKTLLPDAHRVVPYWTTSGYPVQFSELFLLELTTLSKHFPVIGYSGHNLGIAADIAALTLGATWIERHFTLDRTWKGTDQAASLEPAGLTKLTRDLHNISNALRYKGDHLTADELIHRKKLRIC